MLARVAGVDYSVAEALSDDELEARLYRPPLARSSHQLAPDFGVVHQKLKRAGVTLMLRWEEYATINLLACKYTSFCVKYREFAKTRQRPMRQIHIAGETLFVDCAGTHCAHRRRRHWRDNPGPDLRGPARRVERHRRLRYAAPDHRRLDRRTGTGAGVHGGVPKRIVPDQPRALVRAADRYGPEFNPTCAEFTKHYSCAALPARPGHPRDKPKVEGPVLLVQRWILARLCNRRFFSLGELNAAIGLLLPGLNLRPFKALPGCRHSAFEWLDAPALWPLPPIR